VPRQNGKGEILLARQLAGLFLLGEQLIMHSAHEYKTAAEAFLRIKTGHREQRRAAQGVQAAPHLAWRGRHRAAERQPAAVRGPVEGFGRGFSGDCVILDEAYELGPEQMAAMLPTCRRGRTRSSGTPPARAWSPRASCGRCGSAASRATRTGLAYFEWSADPRADPDDREAWAQANPALGIRISGEFIERERDAMPDMEFKRERLGVWDDAATQAVIPLDVWERG
jgi:hypothetical protein